jgi:hypothetical protein
MNMDANLLNIISKESNDSNRVPQVVSKSKFKANKSQIDYKLGATIAPRVRTNKTNIIFLFHSYRNQFILPKKTIVTIFHLKAKNTPLKAKN